MRKGLIAVVLASAACAARVTPEPQVQSIVQWTAATKQLEWLPMEATPDSVGMSPQLLENAPRDFRLAPKMATMQMMPLPVPSNVLGSRRTIVYVVDERGKVERVAFVALPDRGYTQRVIESFRQNTFKPALNADGAPVRGVALVSWSF